MELLARSVKINALLYAPLQNEKNNKKAQSTKEQSGRESENISQRRKKADIRTNISKLFCRENGGKFPNNGVLDFCTLRIVRFKVHGSE
jgi:hypothetical protein